MFSDISDEFWAKRISEVLIEVYKSGNEEHKQFCKAKILPLLDYSNSFEVVKEEEEARKLYKEVP